MERYNVHDEYMTPSEDGNVVLHADAQRALDVEREKVKFGSCEACWNLAWVLCRDDEPNAVPMKCANGTTYWRCDYCWYKQQLATLQAQLDQLATFITVHVPGEPSPTKGSLGAVDCAIHIIINLQAQLRQVEGENELLKSGQRYMALEKERDTLRQLVAQLPVLDMRFDSVAVGPLGWTVGGVTFGKVTEANAYSALLQYRATLAAPSPTEERS